MILYVLIACEESQVECRAFRELGAIAYSCDIQRCARGANPDWHICSDVRPFLKGCTSFCTQSGVPVKVPRWDLIIAHPPCTYMCKVSSVQMVRHGIVDSWRFHQMCLARQFFFECLDAQAKYVAVENPLPMARVQLPRPSCYACPSWFGDRYTKKTLYWLRGLPPLMAQMVNPDTKSLVHCTRSKYRSRTSVFLADALARQWFDFIMKEEEGL